MAWGVRLNRPHVRLWQGLAVLWGAFVLFGLVVGAHLRPRMDEIVIVALLPLAVLIPYAVLSFLLTLLRVFLSRSPLLWGRRGLACNDRLREIASP